MSLLLDTHVLLAMCADRRTELDALGSKPLFASVASIWEMAIKVRLGKLGLAFPLADLEERLGELGCTVLPVHASHVVEELQPWPETNDPFDRLLLAVCSAERLRLVTRDEKLIDHPLAWRPDAA